VPTSGARVGATSPTDPSRYQNKAPLNILKAREAQGKPSLDLTDASSSPKLAYLDERKSPTSQDPDLNLKLGKTTRSADDHMNESSNLDDRDVKSGNSREGRGVDFPRKGRDDAETESMYSTSSREERYKSGASLERSLSSPYESTSSPALSQSTHPTSAGSSAVDRLKVSHGNHPTRSNTAPTMKVGEKSPQDEPTTRRRSEKTCVKCGKKITDGKWILVDSSESEKPTVLCEYDWKMLYLPKCRRCDKPIEGQAIGSKDGQIKGKYHRDCFNCTSCQVSRYVPFYSLPYARQ
jgi:hypothetical protein